MHTNRTPVDPSAEYVVSRWDWPTVARLTGHALLSLLPDTAIRWELVA